MSRVRHGLAAVAAAVGMAGCGRGETCSPEPLPDLPLGDFVPAFAPTDALLTSTVTIDETAVTVVYEDDSGAIWTVVYAIEE